MDFSKYDSFKGFRSTHSLTDPNLLGTTTRLAHHGVGSSTFEMTPNLSMCSSSSRTLSRIGNGTFLVVNNENGRASSCNLIVYSFPQVPSPWKTLGNRSMKLLSET